MHLLMVLDSMPKRLSFHLRKSHPVIPKIVFYNVFLQNSYEVTVVLSIHVEVSDDGRNKD